MLSAVTFRRLEKVLIELGAKLNAREVHALYMGAITSTSFRLGPQNLLGRIFGDEPTLGASAEDANKNLQILFGYWNTILDGRKRGRVQLGPARLSAKPTREELLDYARGRENELLWYVRGIDAGGGDPIEFGAGGQRLLEGIASGAGHLQSYAHLLERTLSLGAEELRQSRAMLLELVQTTERIIADLMDVSDAVRREAMSTFADEAGRKTDDGARVAGSAKVGRNEACPCGSGKKWKKCCGAAGSVH